MLRPCAFFGRTRPVRGAECRGGPGSGPDARLARGRRRHRAHGNRIELQRGFVVPPRAVRDPQSVGPGVRLRRLASGRRMGGSRAAAPLGHDAPSGGPVPKAGAREPGRCSTSSISTTPCSAAGPGAACSSRRRSGPCWRWSRCWRRPPSGPTGAASGATGAGASRRRRAPPGVSPHGGSGAGGAVLRVVRARQPCSGGTQVFLRQSRPRSRSSI